MKKALLILATSVAITGCASSSGVLPMGPDTYSISVTASPARGGKDGARRIAITDASDFCSSKGKEILVNNFSSGGMSSELVFQCLSPGDAGYHRPAYSTVPDAIIKTE